MLNLYRYSLKTRKALLDALEFLKDRIWMPHQVGYEFLNRRCEVIYETIRNYDKMTEEKDKLNTTFANLLRLKGKDKYLIELDKLISDWIIKQKQQNLIVDTHGKDEILNTISKLYDGKTGEPNSEEDLSNIKKEGAGRYEKCIPPGYKDKKKGNDICDNNMYGDLIIWKQILEHSKNIKRNIIFVTADQKEDWWYIINQKTIGPRIELRQEFINYTGQEFHMYSMESFIRIYEKQSGTEFDTGVIDEMVQYTKKYNIKDSIKQQYIYYDSIHDNSIFEDYYYVFLNKFISGISEEEKKNALNLIKHNIIEKSVSTEENNCKSQNEQYYIVCPRCHYQGFSKFENECSECGNIWFD